MVEEDVPDPFQRSFVDDEEGGDLPPLHLRRESMGRERMLTSAELNMKSHLMESRPYSTSSRSDQGRRSGSGSGVSRSGAQPRKEPDSLSDSEVEGEGEGGSQYFPGSGFF